jgi:hypothetical protein
MDDAFWTTEQRPSQQPPGERQNGEAKAGDHNANAPQRRGRRIQFGPFGAIQRMFVRGHLRLPLPLLRVGQSGIDAVRERTDIAVDHDRDGRQDERVFCHRLAAGTANHELTSTDKHLRR